MRDGKTTDTYIEHCIVRCMPSSELRKVSWHKLQAVGGDLGPGSFLAEAIDVATPSVVIAVISAVSWPKP